ncbi:MAG: glutamine synthetase family protein [Streptosporangiaceae bacterium]
MESGDTIDAGADSEAPVPADVLKRIEADDIRNVRLVLTDLYGVARGKVITAHRIERALTEGHPFAIPLFASNLWQRHAPGEHVYSNDIGYRNGVLRLDPRTYSPLPWTPATAHVLTDLYDCEGQIVDTPRAVLRKVLADARALGLTPVFGHELEFYVFRSEPSYQGFAPIYGPQSWFSVHALGMAQRFIDELDRAVTVMGLPVYEIFSEHGAGQFEINLEPCAGLLAADRMVALKIAIKEIAQSLGLRATFMARPTNLDITPPSGYHLHQSLIDTSGNNVLVDAAVADGLSDTARQYIAGQLTHAAGMTAIASPTITGYKRYQVGNWAPVQIAWGIENRTALVRALPDGSDTRIENRLGSSDANPYLLTAVMVAAGLDGVRRNLEPPVPVSENLFESIRFQRLPASPAEGIAALLADDQLVQALGPVFTSTFTDVLRFDWQRYLSHVSDWEISEYREML